MTTKTEEQAEKDKEAVQKMIGAKSAMEAAIRRIERLEWALKNAKRRFEELSIAHGDKIAIGVIRENGWKYISAKEFTREAINDIDDAL